MNLSLRWLQEYLPFEQSVDEIVEALTFTGLEVEGIRSQGAGLDKIIIVQIDSFEQHPNADRLSVCHVDDGSGLSRQIVCGAKNFKAGDKVPLALPGASLPSGTKIKASKLRGVESEGMLCSARELELADDASGLLILDPSAPIGRPLSILYPADTVLELEVTPDRPDLLSYFGIARELAAIFAGSPPKPIPLRTAAEPLKEDASQLKVLESALCPFIVFRKISGVKVGPSPGWMRRRLEAAGLRSINNLVDITNYVMLETGKPIHVYDAAKLRGGLQVRLAKSNEPFLALDGKVYQLLAEDLVIADQEKAVGLGGVMGGEDTGVTEATETVMLESAYFASTTVRRTSRRLGLISDASVRFERGVDPKSVIAASLRATDLISELAGGAVEPSLWFAGREPKVTGQVQMRPSRCEALLGQAVPDSSALLLRIGLQSLKDDFWEVPSFRPDLQREVDLIEEVCRLSGIQKIKGKLGGHATVSSEVDRLHDLGMQLRRRLVGLGFFEARSLTLVDDPALLETLGEPADPVRLRNPLADDQKILRPSLVPGLVKAATRNFGRGAASVSLFEIGKVFSKQRPEERFVLGLLVSGERMPKTWKRQEALFDFYDLKGAIETVLGGNLSVERKGPTSFAALVCDLRNGENKKVGSLGQIRPSLAKELGARDPIFVAEIELTAFSSKKDFRFKPLDRFPSVTRDVALVADSDLKYGLVLETLQSVHEPLLIAVRLFDLFTDPTGQRIPADKKSIACSLTYRAEDRTLVQDEVNAAHQRLKQALIERLGVSLRE